MSKRYNLVNIRTLLVEGFTAAELRDFCYDTPDFKPVYHQLAENAGKTEIVQKLLVHAEQKLLLDALLIWAEVQNPARYATYQPYFEDDLSSVQAGLVPGPVAETSPGGGTSPPPTNLDASTSSALQSSPPPLRIFLCHTAADKPAVRELYHRLRADGFQPWLDEEDLLPGQDWQLEIPKIVHTADVVVICLSHRSITKAGYVQKEIKFALDVADEQPEGRIFLIPLRLEPCDVPERLRRWHWVNLFDDRGYERLTRSLLVRVVEKTEAKPEPRSPISQSPSSQPQILTPTHPFEPEMILIPAGEFLMGSDPKKDEYARENEQPQHALSLPDYYMAKTPVTNTQYVAFVQASGYKPPEHWQNKQPPHGQENHPVVNVSWDDAVAYCRWLAKTTGKPYRLPGEAEWEKGARGTDGRIYPWGNEWDANRCNSSEGGKGDTTPVEAYPAGASPHGLLDMSGNVWEWCSTIWQAKAYPFQVQDEWTQVYLDRTNVFRVLRGGAFIYDVHYVRCAVRSRFSPRYRNNPYGFRVVVSPFS